MNIPAFLLKELYTPGSLRNANGGGAEFALTNRLMDAEVIGLRAMAIDGEPLPLDNIQLEVDGRGALRPGEIDAAHPVPFPVRATMTIRTGVSELKEGRHEIEMGFETRPFGTLQFSVEDSVAVGDA